MKNKKLRVILMSATSDAALYASYFGGNVASVEIAGTTFDVEDHWLPEALARTGFYVNRQGSVSAGSAWWAEHDTGNGNDDNEWEGKQDSESSVGDMSNLTMNRPVPLDLVAATVLEIDSSEAHGAVLVFLSGLDEIVRVASLLRSTDQIDRLLVVCIVQCVWRAIEPLVHR